MKSKNTIASPSSEIGRTGKKSILISLSLLLLLAAGCAAFYPDPTKVEDYQLRASYSQGPCFGRCPVYALKLYDNGLVIYEGRKFTDMPGTWSRQLGRTETARLIDSFELINMSRYPSSYPSRIPDMATKTLSFTEMPSQKNYATSWKEEAPADLEKMARMMQSLVRPSQFKQVSDKIKTGENIIGQPIRVTKEEIIVHLENGVNPDAWVVKYSKQNVTIKEKLTPNGQYYVVLGDPNYMGADELIGFMRADPDVISAQRNRNVNTRD